MSRLTVSGILFLAALATLVLLWQKPGSDSARILRPSQLPNAIEVCDQVISGGLPKGEAAFQELRDRGIKTIISVDGAKPDVAMAEKYGLRYVHLPHGYDGVSESRAMELAKAITVLPGPFYIHCHHGKHRSPAAAAVACIGAGLMEPSTGPTILALAQTSPQYRGLFDSVRAAHRLTAHELAAVESEFHPVSEILPLAQSMVEVERVADRLERLNDRSWNPDPLHPDITAEHEALLLRELFTELVRLNSSPNAAVMQPGMERSQQWAEALEGHLAEGRWMDATDAFSAIRTECRGCHETFRDNAASSGRTSAAQ
jgi:protein tyrosine phosphatase (PTP) superfamily phosphohydrolase (DUF442 family)